MNTEQAKSFILKWVDGQYKSYRNNLSLVELDDVLVSEVRRWVTNRHFQDDYWLGWAVLYDASGYELEQDDWTDILVEQQITRMALARAAELAEAGESACSTWESK